VQTPAQGSHCSKTQPAYPNLVASEEQMGFLRTIRNRKKALPLAGALSRKSAFLAGLLSSLLDEARGALKKQTKKWTDLDVYLINFRGTNQPPTFFFSLFFLARFWAFLGKGSSKTRQKYFYKKSMSKTFSEKILRKSTKISISFSSIFLFYRVFRCFLAMGVQKHYKKRSAKKSCRKVFQKYRQKNPKLTFFDFVYHVFGRFSVRGVQKHDKKISKNNLTNFGTFLASEETTNHVGVRHFFC
jgi:hypothetical protein